jgi:hypothetical protein
MRNSIENQHLETVLARYVKFFYLISTVPIFMLLHVHCTVLILYFVVYLFFLLAKLKLNACPVCKRYLLKKAIL